MRWAAVTAVSLFFGVLLFTFWKGFGRDPHAVPFMLKGQPAPAFSLKRLDTGEAVTLDQLKGKPLVLNFWATWCGPCKLEHPVLNWAHQQYGNRVQFVGVVFEDTAFNARGFLAENGTAFTQVLDDQSHVSVDYGIAGVPETYFIDSAGKIRDKFVGPLEPSSLVSELQLIVSP